MSFKLIYIKLHSIAHTLAEYILKLKMKVNFSLPIILPKDSISIKIIKKVQISPLISMLIPKH